MGRMERDKGTRGEREVAAYWERLGCTVRGLESGGDHLVVTVPEIGVRLHSEVKRHETARPWAWYEQANAEAPPGTIPVVQFRRNRSQWLVLLSLKDFGELVARRTDAGEVGGSVGEA